MTSHTKSMSDHIEMMQTPDRWPLRWKLPLTRGREMGVLLLDVEPRWTVFKPEVLGMFDGRLAAIQAGRTGKVFDALPHETYQDAEGVFDAGWRVD
jgi:hypothetical protein